MLHQHLPQHHDSLDLDGRQLEQLDEKDLRGSELQKISLYNNRLTHFPEQIFRHRDLKVLGCVP
ncbi:hypothetical protein [Serratia aquatilis]|uniref:Leucine-rich repeat domain-containing protein n=1 Tax=Serratia aquatilis TaxID=1737515 RepID=A0ABV6E9T3_9GAMM